MGVSIGQVRPLTQKFTVKRFARSTSMDVADYLDQLCAQVKTALPDATYVTVGREDGQWVIEFYLPRRGKVFQVLRGVTRVTGCHGPTFEDAMARARMAACYHRTGKLE